MGMDGDVAYDGAFAEGCCCWFCILDRMVRVINATRTHIFACNNLREAETPLAEDHVPVRSE